MIKYTYNIPLHYEKIFEKQEKNINLSASNERATRKRLLAQGYFLSLAQGSNFEAQRIKRLSEKCFPGEIKLL